MKRILPLFLCLLILSGCSQDFSGAYEKAVGLFADGEYAEAAKAFDRLEDYANAATYAAYSHGLVLYDQGQFAAAEPYFAASGDFMYSQQRYLFCHGHALIDAGLFAEAAVAFQSIADFENAALWLQYVIARAAEEQKDYETALFGYEAALGLSDAEDRLYNLRGQIYNHAIALKESGSYEDAITLFSLLGDYLSSAEQAIECKAFLLDQQYAQADFWENQGNLQAAYDLFSALSGYRDAARRAESLAPALGIKIVSDNEYADFD